ncbi:MAG: Cysteine desulfurase [Cyanobacteriota bacterium]
MGHDPHHYLDCCATTPLAPEVQQAMLRCQMEAWANPSSLHGFGLTAAEQLERQRQRLALLLGCEAGRVVFTSGGTESIHLAILGSSRGAPTGSRLLLSSVEHPATTAAAAQLQREGWVVQQLPVSRQGLVDLDQLEALLAPPTRLVSLIWGQSDVGTVQPLERIGALCRGAGVPLHVDAVQVVGHQLIRFDALPVDLLSFTAHKLQGPRGVGALLVRAGLPLAPLLGGGGQEGGLRSGTEPVDLVTGLVEALALSQGRLQTNGGRDPMRPLRDALLEPLLRIPGLELTGVDPRQGAADARLPHHISLLARDSQGTPLSGRRLVQQLWREGFAASSGSACSSGQQRPSPVLLAMGYSPTEAQAGLRLSLGPWHGNALLDQLPSALERALERSGF